jgi:hypothetical protein
MGYYLQFAKVRYKDKRIASFVSDGAPVDPEASKRKVRPLIEQTPEFLEQKRLSDQKGQWSIQQGRLDIKYRSTRNRAKKAQITAEYIKVGEDLEKIEQELISQAGVVEKVYQKIFRENSVFSAPRNAMLLSETEAKEWKRAFEKLGPGDFLLEDKTIVSHNQLEEERIGALSDEEFQKERDALIMRKTQLAAQLRSELEIQGIPDALTKAQDWFRTEKAKIEEQYTR